MSAVKNYKYKPEYGKGDHLRQGADNEKYRENFDRIFGKVENTPRGTDYVPPPQPEKCFLDGYTRCHWRECYCTLHPPK